MVAPVKNLLSPIPQDLSSLLVAPKTPWHMSPALFKRMQEENVASKKSFKVCQITQKDHEFNFVMRYFNHQKPPYYGVKSITCVHNPDQIKMFEASLLCMEKETQKFLPGWKNEEPKEERALTIKRWEAQVGQFSPIAVQGSKREDKVINAKVLPLWHGTNQAESICSTGFTYFGKHHMFNADAKAGENKSTDKGFFGSGIYFTNNAHYASMYNSGTLLLSWVSMREPYPVVGDGHKKCADMKNLEGKGAYQNYSAHFIPVVSADPKDPQCMLYYPCSKGVIPAWDEFVVFQSAHALPCFWIELGVDLPKSPSEVPTIGTLLNKILSLLDLKEIKEDKETLDLLSKKSDLLIELDQNSPLSSEDQSFYKWSMMLLDAGGKVRKAVVDKLLKPPKKEEVDKKSENKVSIILPSKIKPDPSKIESIDKNALHQAIVKGNMEALRKLVLQNKHLLEVESEYSEYTGSTPLNFAAMRGDVEACEILLKAGANLESEGLFSAANSGKAALMRLFAVQKNFKDLLEVKNKNRDTLLTLALGRGHVEVCDILLKTGANPKAFGWKNNNTLHCAAISGKPALVNLFVANKDYLEAKNEESDTPLALAVLGGHVGVCDILLKAGG